MKFMPHDYQKYAIEYIKSHPITALFLDMGLGKTVTTLTAIRDLMYDAFEVKRVLVIAPLRVARDTWPDELRKWDHLKELTCSVVVGTVAERRRALQQDADIYIVNRENLAWLYENSRLDFDFRFLVFLHKIKEELLCKLFIFQANQCLFKVKKMKSIKDMGKTGILENREEVTEIGC